MDSEKFLCVLFDCSYEEVKLLMRLKISPRAVLQVIGQSSETLDFDNYIEAAKDCMTSENGLYEEESLRELNLL